MSTPKKKTKVYVGIPTTGTVADLQSYVLRDIAERYKDHVELVYPSMLCRRIFHDYARNGIVEEFMATDCDVLWFLDSDVVPQMHVMDLVALYLDKWEAAAAPYPVFIGQPGEQFPQIVYTIYNGRVGGGMGAANVPKEGHDYVDGAATGCIFLKRSIFEKLEKPYFEFKFDKETRALTEGEDLGFCLKLNKLGIKFFVDFSAVCKHYKNVCLTDVNNYAMSFALKAVDEFDRRIKEQVQEAVLQALQKGKEMGRKEAMQEASGVRTTQSGLILPG